MERNTEVHIRCYAFQAEHNLSLRGSSSRLENDDNSLFLGMLELLSKHNKVLKLHLAQVNSIGICKVECRHIILHGRYKMSYKNMW